MRILAGDFKYKKISYIKNEKLRPTRSIVRKSFFDTVSRTVKGSVFLDLFAGVGSIGLEAVSRGAKEVVFVDKSFKSVKIIKKNIDSMGCDGRVAVFKANAGEFVKSPKMRMFDLVYIDAPYDFDINSLLKELFGNVNKNAIVCIEHLRGNDLDNSFLNFVKSKNKNFGKNSLDYFEVADVQ